MPVRSIISLVALIAAVLGVLRSAPAQTARETRRAEMAARIDALIAQRWKELAIEPAEVSSDAEFMRRAYLDLTGVIPRVSEARAFLADKREDRRVQLVDDLLSSPAHATHLANTWRHLMLPNGFEIEQANATVGVQNWLRNQFVDNMRYDRIVSELLVSNEGGQSGPALFYTSHETKPEKLAAATARIFLGLQIECAECHDHPFDRWKQTDFWGYAAFFARLRQSEGMNAGMRYQLEDLPEGEVRIPKIDEVAKPKFPGGEMPEEDASGSRRVQLSIWMASRENPYLAKAAVNRIWGQLFGRGLVEPVDDLSENNLPSHPQLFQELTQYFVEIGFDVRELYRTLAMSQTYQLSSAWKGEKEPPTEAFARAATKPLSPDQLYDSINRVLARRANGAAMAGLPASPLLDPTRQAFLARIQSPSRTATEYSAGALQALMLMNGTDIAMATAPKDSALLASMSAPWLADAERVEILFLATYARFPTEEERQLFAEHAAAAKTDAEKELAWSDLLWVMLNSAEFAINH
jgi:hypothetical protein